MGRHRYHRADSESARRQCHYQNANLPTVAVGLTDEQKKPGNPLAEFPELSLDASEVARFAAEHLIERHFRHFAYVGMDERGWSHRREVAFQAQSAWPGSTSMSILNPNARPTCLGKRCEHLAAWRPKTAHSRGAICL